MTKTLNQIFFSSTKIRIFFQQHWKSEYFFRKKNHTFVAQLFFEIYKGGLLVWIEHPILYTRYPLWSTVRLSVLYPDNPTIHNPVRTEQLSECETWEVLQR